MFWARDEPTPGAAKSLQHATIRWPALDYPPELPEDPRRTMPFDLLRITAALAVAALAAPFAPLQTAGETAPQDEPAVLIEGAPTAVLRFEIQDESGAPMPGRLTFIGEGGGTPELFDLTDARPNDPSLAFQNSLPQIMTAIMIICGCMEFLGNFIRVLK